MDRTILQPSDIAHLADDCASQIALMHDGAAIRLYGVPRGGVPATFAVALALTRLRENGQRVGHIIGVDNPADASCFIDDIIDSGATRARFDTAYPGVPFFALVDKTEIGSDPGGWVVFPWEHAEDAGFEENVRRMLQAVDPDAGREGLVETPKRVARAWEYWASGYSQDPRDVLKVFEDGAERYDELVIVKDIPIYSKCEHHLADIFGTATVGYIPNGRVVGLSKLSRVVDIFARRLQVQERLTAQIADAIDTALNPLGVGVFLRCRHMCMESRGICQQGHHTITSALRGGLKSDPAARAEFMSLANASAKP